MKVALKLLFGITLLLLFYSSNTSKACATWPLNTPEIQTNPMWAGDELVWSDNRLGNWDIFIRHPDQTVNALLVLPDNQTLVSATPDAIYFYDSGAKQNYIYNLKTAVLKPFHAVLPNYKTYHTLYDNRYELAEAVNQDILLRSILAPSISLSSDLTQANISTLSGSANGEVIYVRAVGPTVSYNASALVTNGEWQIANLIPTTASDGEYTLFGYASMLTNIASSEINLGTLVLDHAPPSLTSEIELTPALDEVKIHWHTNEKSTAEVILNADSDIIIKKYTRETYSHTLTVNDLAPNTAYKLIINSTDIYGNSATFLSQFTTLDIISTPLINISDAQVKKELVWQAVVLAEPGIIDADKSLVKIDNTPIILEWTTGLPPSNLNRGQTIRFIASLNHDKGALLIHGSKTLQIINNPTENILIEKTITPEVGQWFYFEGEITHLTKSYWVIKNKDIEIKVYWHSPPDGNWKKGQTISLDAVYYMDKEGNNKVAGYKATLISDVKTPSPKQKTAKKPPPKMVSASVKQIEPQLDKILPKTTVTNTISVTDKMNLLWYSSVLIGLSIVTFIIFFIRHRQS